MAPANVIIRHSGIDQCGIHVGMAEEPLNLFQGHTVPQRNGGNGMPEHMGRDVNREVAVCAGNDGSNGFLNGFRIEGLVGLPFGTGEDERGRIMTGINVSAERNLCFSVQVGCPGDVPLPVLDDNGLFLPVDIRQSGMTDFRYSGSGRVQEVNQGLFPGGCASVTEIFKLNTLHPMPG